MALPELFERKQQFYAACGENLHARLLQRVQDVFAKTFETSLDPRVEKAMASVPRHLFVPDVYPFSRVYRNTILPLEIGMIEQKIREAGIPFDQEKPSDETVERVLGIVNNHNATASEPALVAYMTQLVLPEKNRKNPVALDIGSGTGYQTALLRAVGFSKVTAIEHKPHLVQVARTIFQDDPNVTVLCQDGKKGIPEERFDAIVVAAQTNNPDVITTLASQLKTGGKLILPVSASLLAAERPRVRLRLQTNQLQPDDGILTLVTKKWGMIQKEMKGNVRFVPLV